VDFLYTFGPTAIGIIVAVSIAAYCWKRVRAASLTVIAWFAVSLGVSQFAFFSESQASELEALIRFTIFGTFAFGPAAVLIFMSLKITKFSEETSLSHPGWSLFGLCFLWRISVGQRL